MIGLKGCLNVRWSRSSCSLRFNGSRFSSNASTSSSKRSTTTGALWKTKSSVVKQAGPVSAAAQASATAVEVRRGDVRRAVIVRTKEAVRRPDGRYVRFDDNAAVLLNNKREMLGIRIGGVVSANLRMKGWGKIASLALKVGISDMPDDPSLVLGQLVGHMTLRLIGYIPSPKHCEYKLSFERPSTRSLDCALQYRSSSLDQIEK